MANPILTGDIGGIVPAATVARLRGSCRLVDELHVRGTLTWDETGVTVDGQNLYGIHTHDGGRLGGSGVVKSAWVEWGTPVVGWQVGDRLAVAPTAASATAAIETVWSGSWGSMTRPASAPDVVLRNGRVMKPEVVNLGQTVVFQNLTHVMFHAPSAAQSVKYVRLLNCGVTSLLGEYPIHFHVNGDTSRGSLLEGVVVEGGKNHAFVPHGSHGVTFRDCAAYKTKKDVFWWDTPGSPGSVGGGLDASHDVTYDHCLVLMADFLKAANGAGFRLAEGEGGIMRGCRAVLVRFAAAATGVHWRFDTGVWDFSDWVGHNNGGFGLSVWDNSGITHLVEDMVGYRNVADFDHGAYGNLYHYRSLVGSRFVLHAKSEESPGEADFLTVENASLDVLAVTKHQLGRMRPAKVVDSDIGAVVYTEYAGQPSWMRYEDCGLAPSDFTLTQIRPGSIIEIFEGGILTNRWASGSWT